MNNVVWSIKVLLELGDKFGKRNDIAILPAFEGYALRCYDFGGKIGL